MQQLSIQQKTWGVKKPFSEFCRIGLNHVISDKEYPTYGVTILSFWYVNPQIPSEKAFRGVQTPILTKCSEELED